MNSTPSNVDARCHLKGGLGRSDTGGFAALASPGFESGPWLLIGWFVETAPDALKHATATVGFGQTLKRMVEEEPAAMDSRVLDLEQGCISNGAAVPGVDRVGCGCHFADRRRSGGSLPVTGRDSPSGHPDIPFCALRLLALAMACAPEAAEGL